jgi:glycosyltransferase involved in cell wall biosynthesis
VTVITPSFMQGRFIRDCIESVRGQRYPRLEHLILDADSTDCTADAVAAYLGSYDLTFIQERDRGQAHAINKGLTRARGDIVCWLNSDDLFCAPDALELVVDAFRRHPDADVVTGGGCCIDAHGKFLFAMPVFDQRRATVALLSRRCVLMQPATFWRANAVRLDESLEYLFDWKCWIEMKKADLRFYSLDACLAIYRRHADGKTVTDTARRKKETVDVNRYGGASAATVGWSMLMYFLYLLSERIRLPSMKWLLTKINNGAAIATNYHLFSQ